MENTKSKAPAGRYLPGRRKGRWMVAAVLLAWDGLLLYMIVRCLIVPVYGGIFIAAVSVYLGYQL